MLFAKFNAMDLNKTLENTIDYSIGFMRGVELEKIFFNERLSDFVIDALNKYIDAKARSNPAALHHVYEWDNVGNPSARLFSFSAKSTNSLIVFNGTLKKSTSVSKGSKEPFENKAQVMENSITVTIEPKTSDVLVFDYNNETIFTSKTITIDDPGGPFVAGSFAKTVEEFFNNFLTSSLLRPYFIDLATANEFTQSFGSVKGTGARSSGIKAGKNYLRVTGSVVQ